MKKLIYLVLSVLCAISGMPDVSFYDTLEISQTLLPQLDRHRLLDLIRYFGIAKTERHRAGRCRTDGTGIRAPEANISFIKTYKAI